MLSHRSPARLDPPDRSEADDGCRAGVPLPELGGSIRQSDGIEVAAVEVPDAVARGLRALARSESTTLHAATMAALQAWAWVERGVDDLVVAMAGQRPRPRRPGRGGRLLRAGPARAAARRADRHRPPDAGPGRGRDPGGARPSGRGAARDRGRGGGPLRDRRVRGAGRRPPPGPTRRAGPGARRCGARTGAGHRGATPSRVPTWSCSTTASACGWRRSPPTGTPTTAGRWPGPWWTGSPTWCAAPTACCAPTRPRAGRPARRSISRSIRLSIPRSSVSLGEWFARIEAAHAARPALRDGRQTLTYAELGRRARAVAAELGRLGVRPGDPVVLRLERSIEWVVAMLGVVLADAAYVPVDPGAPAERTAAMLADLGPCATIDRDGMAAPPTGEVVEGLGSRVGDRRRPAGLRPVHLRLDRAAQGGGGQPGQRGPTGGRRRLPAHDPRRRDGVLVQPAVRRHHHRGVGRAAVGRVPGHPRRRRPARSRAPPGGPGGGRGDGDGTDHRPVPRGGPAPARRTGLAAGGPVRRGVGRPPLGAGRARRRAPAAVGPRLRAHRDHVRGGVPRGAARTRSRLGRPHRAADGRRPAARARRPGPAGARRCARRAAHRGGRRGAGVPAPSRAHRRAVRARPVLRRSRGPPLPQRRPGGASTGRRSWCSWGGPTPRSRSAGTASSWARSRRRCAATPMWRRPRCGPGRRGPRANRHWGRGWCPGPAPPSIPTRWPPTSARCCPPTCNRGPSWRSSACRSPPPARSTAGPCPSPGSDPRPIGRDPPGRRPGRWPT